MNPESTASAGFPWQTLLLASLLLLERVYLAVKTYPRETVRFAAGSGATLTWGVCFIGTLAGAVLGLDLFGPVVPAGRFAPAIVLFGAGLLLRVWAVTYLGRQYSEWVVLREGHRLVTGGPYRIVRHPLHAGLLAEILAMAALGRAWWGYVLFLLATVTAFTRELHEEAVLRGHFGETYEAYHARSFGLTDLLGRRTPR